MPAPPADPIQLHPADPPELLQLLRNPDEGATGVREFPSKALATTYLNSILGRLEESQRFSTPLLSMEQGLRL